MSQEQETQTNEIIPYSSNLNIKSFSCGNDKLDLYAKNFLSQDVKRDLAVCYCVCNNGRIVGFYTLSSSSVPAEEYLTIKKGVGSYLPIPVTLIGRLAVDRDFSGQGLGGSLLLDAMERSLRSSLEIASKAIIVDAIDEDAVSFYEKFGFSRIPSSMKMLLTMNEVRSLLGNIS